MSRTAPARPGRGAARAALVTCALAAAATVGLGAIHAPPAAAAVEDDLRDGDKYFEDGDWNKAAAAYDRAIAKAPGQVPAEAYGKRAAVFIILKDYKGGLDFIQNAKARYPSAPEVLEQEALILWETDRRDEAIKIAETVVAARPKAFTNQKLIGEYYAARDPVRTMAAYEQYLANRPGDLEAGDVLPRVRLGFAYLAVARLAIAESDDARAQRLFGKAADQFDIVQRKFGKKPNAQVNADNGLCAALTGMGRFDQAVTVCERVTADPGRIDTSGSSWYNLATAYLARKQTRKARTAGLEFTRLRKTEARGFILLGDTYFAERDWAGALDQYLRAEKLLRPNQPHDQVQLSIRLGKTYRRLPAPSGGTNTNLALALDKLSTAFNANPGSVELALELGSAYLEARQDARITTLTDRMLASPELAKAPPEARGNMLMLSGKALFNQHKLKEARQRFEAARELRPTDITIQRALVLAINEQAFEADAPAGGLPRDPRAAQGLLEQALAIDPQSPVTITNLAVLAIDRGECDAARQQLARLEPIRGHDTVMRARLVARTYLCGARPDVKKAGEAYATAEREAKKASAAMALAEIYTEWAPLTWDTDLGDAIEKLEIAVQTSAQDPAVASAAKRNLALALYRRGWRLMRDAKATEAAADFEKATRDPSVLRGSEPLAFEFSYALALLDTGRAADAGRLFKNLAAKGNQGSYLKGAYARLGTQLFAAYAGYRNGSLATRQQAASELARLVNEPGLADKVKELLAACWESIAIEQWRAGQMAAAGRSLAAAEKYATGEIKRRIVMDRAALSLGKNDLGTMEGLGGNPPESLVNLGILYDQLGRTRDAYDAWTRAKARGVQARDLQRWIDAKKRIYGY
ncbi:MAG TPA: tetratricopeptide repeat protein [Kofleriaceae bacterium]|nr:tetratricopeptide repeat protein [Kofleriaceae bacterium]